MEKVLLNEQYHEFILSQVVRPYQGMLGREKRIENLRYVPFGGGETSFNYFELQNYAWEFEMLNAGEYKTWFEAVIERLSKIYKQCDYSFFPQNDLFANTLKRRMIDAGIKSIDNDYWMPPENYPIEIGFAENLHRYNELSELVPELVYALQVCYKSLCTYGSHPIIEKHVNAVMKKADKYNKKMSNIFPIGQKVYFHSGNFIGHNGVVKKVEDESKDPAAIFGFLIHVELDNGKMVLVEKSEHISKIK